MCIVEDIYGDKKAVLFFTRQKMYAKLQSFICFSLFFHSSLPKVYIIHLRSYIWQPFSKFLITLFMCNITPDISP